MTEMCECSIRECEHATDEKGKCSEPATGYLKCIEDGVVYALCNECTGASLDTGLFDFKDC